MVERSDTIGYGTPNGTHPERVQAKSLPHLSAYKISDIWNLLAPFQGARDFGFGFRWYRCAQPPAKGWHPCGMR
jgi:hypothetical protein